ncbi:hypothetical protein [Egicoccus halophilus]|nr:hypothetical protein [Egicoccus halophilus]
MKIDKDQITDMLKQRGDDQQAQQADKELPQQVDTEDEQDQNLLQKFGIDPQALAKQFLGGKGIPGM